MKESVLQNLLNRIKALDLPYKPFIREQEFDKLFQLMCKIIAERLTKCMEEYKSKLDPGNTECFDSMVKINEDEFISDFHKYFGNYNIPVEQKREFYRRLRMSGFKDWSIAKEYGLYNFWYRDIWTITFQEYVSERKNEISEYSSNPGLSELLKEELFTGYSVKFFYDNHTFNPIVIESIREAYYKAQGKYMKLVENAVKYLDIEATKPLSSWIVNIGERTFKSDHHKLYNYYTLVSQNKKHEYVNKNDCKQITDVFANIYFLSGNELLKISIGSEKLLQRTVYLVSKDIQRADIFDGKIIELHMHKHFDPEVILFEEDADAYAFQAAITRQRAARHTTNWRQH